MKSNRLSELVFLTAAFAIISAGCVERQVVYVPTYVAPRPTSNPPAGTYSYTNQTLYQPAPGQVSPASATRVGTNAAPANALPLEPTAGTVIQTPTAPPPAQAEAVPVAPGPDYTWTPGYWSWSGSTWVWVGGSWVIRPRVGVVWVPGHWVWRRHGYVWVGGYWR